MQSDLLVIPFAPIGTRFLAFILDSIILCIPCAIMDYLMPYGGSVLVLFFYGPVFESSALQATLGKYLLRIQVTDLLGRRISFRTALIRSLLKVISTVVFFLGFFFAFFTRRKQTFHDLLADTIVVNGQAAQSVIDAWTDNVRGVVQNGWGASSTEKLIDLERLQTLRERGALTEEEFQAEKRKILKTGPDRFERKI